ncbi:hypothetical protein [Mitsuokella jalaludinii]|uniref:hypothetical protein n=1 Tax=Mitsuokella jalaludinii TaxID=187979 RepID=UPI00307EDC34
MQELELLPVKTGKVLKMLKECGAFMLLDHNDSHYLVTEYFILQLRERDAWLIQCGMAVEQRNRYYVKIKKEWQESMKPAEADAVVTRYESLVTQAAAKTPSYWTGITIARHHDTEMDGRLFVSREGYALLRGDYLEMVGDGLPIVCVGGAAVAGGQHVLTLLPDDAWQENDFIKHYEWEGES